MEADPTLRYRDIAVLTRVKQNVLAPMARVLADEGIPVYADEAGGYTDAFEVRLALALLKLVDNHLDDLSLLPCCARRWWGFPAGNWPSCAWQRATRRSTRRCSTARIPRSPPSPGNSPPGATARAACRWGNSSIPC